jgi:hypothetical protein
MLRDKVNFQLTFGGDRREHSYRRSKRLYERFRPR